MRSQSTLWVKMSVALFSASYTLTTGQAIVTRRVVESVLPKLGGAVEYVYLPGGQILAILSWLRAVIRLWRDVASGRVSTLYVVCSRSNAGFVRDLPALITAKLGVRVIVHAHGSEIVGLLKGRSFSPVARWIYAPCELIVPSYHLVPPLAELGLVTVVVVENYAHIVIKSSDLAATHVDGLVLLWNSNVMASKGVFDTLEAVAEIQLQGVPLVVHVLGSVIGDGEMTARTARTTLQNMKRRMNMVLHGRVDAADAAQRLAEADVVALPSRHPGESQGIAIVEAMCAGKALIISDIEALRATVRDYPAEVVQRNSVAAICDALLRLDAEKRTDPSGFTARRAAPAAAARLRFSAERFDEEMTKIFQLRQ